MDVAFVFSIEPFHWSSIGMCLLCGFIIGLERQLRGKPVGIRTSSLIVLGTHMFIVASTAVNSQATDPSRIISQVVSGIGFLGAGVMLSKDGVVMGVTSAATIWILAALGVCISTLNLWISAVLAIVVVLILYGVDLLEDYSSVFTRGVHAKFQDWKTKTLER